MRVRAKAIIRNSDFTSELTIIIAHMFDFEKLNVYHKAKSFNALVNKYIRSNENLDQTAINQLRKASLSIMLNIAEGYSRFSTEDRKNFYVIARGSIFECVAMFDVLIGENLIEADMHQEIYSKLEELSK
ncbi:MAG: four helix bundle protein, partial [Flavobacteriales bacterium]